ncbi:MAG: tyrosine-type recombinase/integrase [Rhodobacteraceae bacterium]|nr:tyrosine-type recombinase/integrase [Paracoccaceae bacterium]
MPLKIYQRGDKWWFKGRIARVPFSRYYRQSTGVSATCSEEEARTIASIFEQKEIKRHYAGEELTLTFSEAVLLYRAGAQFAGDLLAILPHLGEIPVAKITPQQVRNLGEILYPDNSTDSWQRHVITPVRAVINNAHDLGKCPSIRIKAFSTAERLKQDKRRKKQSRIEKTPADWPWIHAFRKHANRYQAAMALFMFETGARISQATSMVPADLDLQNARVWMPEAKGVASQWVPISMEMVVELANLPPRRPRKGPHNTTRYPPRVFGYAGKDGVYKAWKTACKKAGIEPIMPHAAGRHGFATEMLVRQGLDAATVARGGRWADLSLMQKTYVHAGDTTDKIQTALRTGRVQSQSLPNAKKLKNQKKS